MACTAFQTPNENSSGYYFGRNFDWADCHALSLVNYPDNGYSSISTVNIDFINWIADELPYEKLVEKYFINREPLKTIPDDALRALALYGPLDGINEKGLSISVNMLESPIAVNQNYTDNINLTTLSIVRVILDKAASVDEAVDLLQKINYHSTLNVVYHYLISNASGNSVAIEYINDEIVVTEAKIITNFYVADGMNKLGFGQDRYEIVEKKMAEQPNMNVDNVRETLEASASGTLWIYDQVHLEATYYLFQNFEQGYNIKLNVNCDDDFDDNTLVVSDSDIDEEEDSDFDSSDEKN